MSMLIAPTILVVSPACVTLATLGMEQIVQVWVNGYGPYSNAIATFSFSITELAQIIVTESMKYCK